jgi:hypothetical protein
VFVEVVVVFVSHREDEEWERCVKTPHPPQAVPLPLIGEGKGWSKRSIFLFGGKARVWGAYNKCCMRTGEVRYDVTERYTPVGARYVLWTRYA